jgi:hypothetical protein
LSRIPAGLHNLSTARVSSSRRRLVILITGS